MEKRCVSVAEIWLCFGIYLLSKAIFVAVLWPRVAGILSGVDDVMMFALVMHLVFSRPVGEHQDKEVE